MRAPTLTIGRLGYCVRGHTLLRSVSLVSEANTCTALLGPNGAGKTTLLRLCHGLIEPGGGEVHWGRQKPREMGRRIAMVFQKPCLLQRSARENIDYVLRTHRFPRAERRQRVDRAFAQVGLEYCINRPARLLSSGEQQRLAIARACVLDPDIILLDEPTARLDMESIEMVERAIAGLRESGVKVILASHNFSQVRKLCDEVIFLDKGRLVAHTSCADFFSNQGGDKKVCEFIRLQASF